MKKEKGLTFGALYILGIVAVIVFLYADYKYPQGAHLILNESIPLTIRIILAIGVPVVFIIGVTDTFKRRFFSGTISFVILAMMISRSFF